MNPLISYETEGNSNILIFHNCITALDEYKGKSLEELRWEDYQLGRRFPITPASQLSVSTRRPLVASPLNQGSQFCKYKVTVGADFKTYSDGSMTYSDTNHMPITAMPEYENASFEELRYADYNRNCKFPRIQQKPNNKSQKDLTSNLTTSNTLKNKSINTNKDASKVNSVDTKETNLVCTICLEQIIKVRVILIS